MIGLNNKKIGFIVDSSSNIKNNQFDDVKVVPLGVTIKSGDQIKTYKDGIDFSIVDLQNALLNQNADVKTSQAAMPDMLKVCSEMCPQYDYVVVLPIHKNLSSNLNTWKMLKDDFPNLCVAMSCDITISFAWTIEEIKDFLKNNECNEANIQNFIDTQILPKRFGFLMVEDLTQLSKGGRVSGIKAALAKLFKIYPIILFDGNGLTNFDKAKNNESFFQIVDRYHNEKYPGTKVVRTFLAVPPGYDSLAKQYISDYQSHYGNQPYDETTFPVVVICHTGLKHVAIYFEVK